MFTGLFGEKQAEDAVSSSTFARGKTPFHKQLKWLIHNPPEHSVVMEITPTIAQELLKHNHIDEYDNRPLSEATVLKYARAIEAGWKLTGETIIVSKSGHLLNGQHRLHACIKAQKPFRTHVIFGIDDDAFAWMDIGKKRSTADIFSIKHVPNASCMAAAIVWVWRYEKHGMGQPPIYPSHEDLYQFYKEQNGIQQSYTSGHRFTEYKIASPSLMVALHYLCSKKSKAQADTFFERVATGVGFSKQRDPGFILRKRLLEDKIGGRATQDLFVGAFTVQAWNATRENKPTVLLRWRGEQNPEQPFPRIA